MDKHPETYAAYFRGYQHPMHYLEVGSSAARPSLLEDLPEEDLVRQPVPIGFGGAAPAR